jgi:hypothetical protein
MVWILVALGLASYLAGLLSFKVKSRWCDRCGSWTHRAPGARRG